MFDATKTLVRRLVVKLIDARRCDAGSAFIIITRIFGIKVWKKKFVGLFTRSHAVVGAWQEAASHSGRLQSRLPVKMRWGQIPEGPEPSLPHTPSFMQSYTSSSTSKHNQAN